MSRGVRDLDGLGRARGGRAFIGNSATDTVEDFDSVRAWTTAERNELRRDPEVGRSVTIEATTCLTLTGSGREHLVPSALG